MGKMYPPLARQNRLFAGSARSVLYRVSRIIGMVAILLSALMAALPEAFAQAPPLAPGQTETVTCAGAHNPATISNIVVSMNNRTCVISDGVGSSTGQGFGSMRFIARPEANINGGIYVQVRPQPSGDNFRIENFDICDMPGGLTTHSATGCAHRSHFVPGGTGIYQTSEGVNPLRLIVTYTTALNASGNFNDITIVSATAIFGALPPLPGAANPSASLDNQQAMLTPLIINHHAATLLGGVTGSTDRLLGVSGPAFLDQNGFALSSAGLAERMAHRHEEEAPVNAFDLFAPRKPAHLAGRGAGRGAGRVKEQRFGAGIDLEQAAIAQPVSSPILPWNTWLTGRWTFFDSDDSAFDGHIADLAAGVDYRLTENLIVGVLGGYGIASFDTKTAAGKGSFSADGLSGGAYLGWLVAPGVLFDAMAAYTGTDYDNRAAGVTGDFDARRITLATNLKGRADLGALIAEPGIAFWWASEHQDGYTDSAGVAHGERTVTAGRLSAGPKFILPMVAGTKEQLQVWFAALAEYDFSSQSAGGTSALPDLGDGVSARIKAGFDAHLANGAKLTLQAEFSGLGNDNYTAWGGMARLAIPLQ